MSTRRPSVMTGAGANTGFNMAQNTTFNVASTGGASPDLTVSRPLGDVQFGLASAFAPQRQATASCNLRPPTLTRAIRLSTAALWLGRRQHQQYRPPRSAINFNAGGHAGYRPRLSGGGLALGATQTLSGFGTVHGAVTSGGTASQIVPGSLTKIGTLATGNLDVSAGGNLTFVLGSPGLGSLINVTGNVTLPSTQIASLNLLNNGERQRARIDYQRFL